MAVISGFCYEARAAKVTLAWDPSPDASVIGYRVYTKLAGSPNVAVVETGNTTTATIENLVEGKTYTIYMTAYDATRFESTPSNSLTYSVPNAPAPVVTGFALQFGGFTHATAQYSPHGTMGAKGEVYAPGTRVTLTGIPESGYVCTGWVINGVVVAGNPGIVTMNQNTLVTPVLKKQAGGSSGEPLPTSISLKITAPAGKPTISVGGELGAWILEGTRSLGGSWFQVAQGLTSGQLTLTPTESAPYAFYRVRSASLPAF